MFTHLFYGHNAEFYIDRQLQMEYKRTFDALQLGVLRISPTYSTHGIIMTIIPAKSLQRIMNYLLLYTAETTFLYESMHTWHDAYEINDYVKCGLVFSRL